MNRRTAFVVAVLWVASLVGTGLWAQGREGQTPEGQKPEVFTVRPGQPFGPIISGNDLGFQRVAGATRPGTIGGRLVVRVGGEWLEVVFPATLRMIPTQQ